MPPTIAQQIYAQDVTTVTVVRDVRGEALEQALASAAAEVAGLHA